MTTTSTTGGTVDDAYVRRTCFGAPLTNISQVLAGAFFDPLPPQRGGGGGGADRGEGNVPRHRTEIQTLRSVLQSRRSLAQSPCDGVGPAQPGWSEQPSHCAPTERSVGSTAEQGHPRPARLPEETTGFGFCFVRWKTPLWIVQIADWQTQTEQSSNSCAHL
jgi:hypothetical protein